MNDTVKLEETNLADNSFGFLSKIEEGFASFSPIKTIGCLFLLMFLSFGAFDPLATFGDDYLTVLDGLHMEYKGYELGRWGVVLLWNLFAENSFFAPFSLYIGMFFVASAGYLLTEIFDIDRVFEKLLFAGLFVTTPFLLDIISLKMRHITTTSAVLLPVLAAYLFYRRKNHSLLSYLGVAVPIVLTLSIYPSNISILLLIIMAKESLELLEQGVFDWKKYGKIIGFIFAGLILYLGSLFALKLTGNAATGGANAYSISKGNVNSLSTLFSSMKETYEIFFNYLLFKNESIPLLYSWGIAAISALAIISVLMGSHLKALGKVLFLIAIALFPLVALGITIPKISWPHRYSLYLPYALIPVLLGLMTLKITKNRSSKLRLVTKSLAFACLIMIVISNAVNVYASNLQWQQTLLYGNRVLAQIENTETYVDNRRRKKVTQIETFQIKAGKPKLSAFDRKIGTSLHACNLMNNCQRFRISALLNRIKGRADFGGYDMYKSPNKFAVPPKELPDQLISEKDGRIIVVIH